jgi:ATP adenylyltransferase
MGDGAPKDECLFCRIGRERDDEKNFVLERGRRWYTIINRYPYTTGHIMVVCNRHVEGLADLDGEENDELPELLARCERAIRAAYGPDGINLGANLGRSAGAGVVGHIHVHLVPRWHGDTNFMTAVGDTRVVSEDLRESWQRLRDALAGLD